VTPPGRRYATGPLAELYESDRASFGHLPNLTLDGLGAEPDAHFAELEPELRATLTVGRPIAAG
jgi:hypothetical protein